MNFENDNLRNVIGENVIQTLEKEVLNWNCGAQTKKKNDKKFSNGFS